MTAEAALGDIKDHGTQSRKSPASPCLTNLPSTTLQPQSLLQVLLSYLGGAWLLLELGNA